MTCLIAISSKNVGLITCVTVFLFDFSIPVFVIGFCYGNIIRRTVGKGNNSVGTAAGTVPVERLGNIARVLGLASLAFVLTVGPRQITLLYGGIVGSPVEQAIYLPILGINYANCAITPFIYASKYPGFFTLFGIAPCID